MKKTNFEAVNAVACLTQKSESYWGIDSRDFPSQNQGLECRGRFRTKIHLYKDKLETGVQIGLNFLLFLASNV